MAEANGRGKWPRRMAEWIERKASEPEELNLLDLGLPRWGRRMNGHEKRSFAWQVGSQFTRTVSARFARGRPTLRVAR